MFKCTVSIASFRKTQLRSYRRCAPQGCRKLLAWGGYPANFFRFRVVNWPLPNCYLRPNTSFSWFPLVPAAQKSSECLRWSQIPSIHQFSCWKKPCEFCMSLSWITEQKHKGLGCIGHQASMISLIYQNIVHSSNALKRTGEIARKSVFGTLNICETDTWLQNMWRKNWTDSGDPGIAAAARLMTQTVQVWSPTQVSFVATDPSCDK